ncbi:helix-turn-helix domain-containing protein [Streptomyces xanthophaeus]|uniref:helix-turn-helix domain-containing protein n=1 Tax=Streptomyces xanthophaeus TaxID=67385 RepID=UPI00387078C6|nr:helix-turn-helix domain-containing protein [Streptomyces xanthophaeus]WST62180.1 helix-turn-helix domain-containing protein [Streptomyces xanthophaeus]
MPQKAADTAPPGRQLRRRRLKLGLTLEDLAARCAAAGVPVHHSTLSKLETGRHRPRPHLRHALASVLALDDPFDEPDGSPA